MRFVTFVPLRPGDPVRSFELKRIRLTSNHLLIGTGSSGAV
ncbi:Hypothetical protein A7982_05065 [Minicystis rosea]|nr:Hypothetical protein A7982_05065 [Minicystis rosea]